MTWAAGTTLDQAHEVGYRRGEESRNASWKVDIEEAIDGGADTTSPQTVAAYIRSLRLNRSTLADEIEAAGEPGGFLRDAIENDDAAMVLGLVVAFVRGAKS